MTDLSTVTDEEMRTILQYAQTYTVVILRAGPNYGTAKAKPLIWEHSRRNFGLRASGALSVILNVSDDTDVCGIGVFDRDAETTTALMNDDPAVQAGIFHVDVHPVRGFPGDALSPRS